MNWQMTLSRGVQGKENDRMPRRQVTSPTFGDCRLRVCGQEVRESQRRLHGPVLFLTASADVNVKARNCSAQRGSIASGILPSLSLRLAPILAFSGPNMDNV